MTKRREPLTFHRALTQAAAIIGWDQCAAICGVSERTVRNYSDPDAESEICLQDALRIDRACIAAGGDHAPFHRVYTLRLDIAAREAAAKDLARAAANAARETGEAVSALILASSPDACANIRRDAKREAEEAIGSLTEGLAALKRQEAAERGG